mmetsp:Transcript_407/g.492  ORF Transcript_407/g.492 Transcript_407/m.492 type:complete len:694 (-) Transcript_407:1500-3581(-)
MKTNLVIGLAVLEFVLGEREILDVSHGLRRGNNSACIGKSDVAVIPPGYAEAVGTFFLGFCCEEVFYDMMCVEFCQCNPNAGNTCYKAPSDNCIASANIFGGGSEGQVGQCVVQEGPSVDPATYSIDAKSFCQQQTQLGSVPKFKPESPNPVQVGAFSQIIDPATNKSSTGSIMTHAALIPDSSRVVVWSRGQKADLNYEPNMYGTFSAIYDTTSGKYSPSKMVSSPFCSGHSYLEDGTIFVTGGEETGMPWGKQWAPWATDGLRGVREFKDNRWTDSPLTLFQRRWYPTQLSLDDGRVLIVGGFKSMLGNVSKSVEIYDSRSKTIVEHEPTHFTKTVDAGNLYPYMAFLPFRDGSSSDDMFILQFVENYGEIIRLTKDNKIETFQILPSLPDHICTHFSGTGTGRLLALRPEDDYTPEFISFGGTTFDEEIMSECMCSASALSTSYRLRLDGLGNTPITESRNTSEWVIEDMPYPRVGGTNVLLPNGHVVLLNGGETGAGNHLVGNPLLTAVMYNPYGAPNQRYKKLATSEIPRTYHSNAMLLPSGNILVGGGDQGACYSTRNGAQVCGSNYVYEYRAEEFQPPYAFAKDRLRELRVENNKLSFGSNTTVSFATTNTNVTGASIVFPSAVTHSTDMSGRVVFCEFAQTGQNQVILTFPERSSRVTTAGWHMVFLLSHNNEVVSDGSVWVHLS